MNRLSCCPVIDQLFGGGIESGVLTTVYGPPASGKSTLCMHACVSALREGKVVYIDTEGNFSPERFSQVGGSADPAVMDKLLQLRPASMEDQAAAITSILGMSPGRIALVIVDSIVMPYRVELTREREHGTGLYRALGKMVYNLGLLAARRDIPVLATSQVYEDFSTGKDVVVGGDVIRFGSKALLELRRDDAGDRTALLRKHRSLPERQVRFRIAAGGMEGIYETAASQGTPAAEGQESVVTPDARPESGKDREELDL